MEIVQFIKKELIEKLTNNGIDPLIYSAMASIFESYGLQNDEDLILDTDNWALEELDADVPIIKDIIQPVEYIKQVYDSANKMTNNTTLPFIIKITNSEEGYKDFFGSKLPSPFQYKNRHKHGSSKIFTHLLGRNPALIPAILALNLLLPNYKKPNPNIESIILATRLIEIISLEELMLSISKLWEMECHRNYNADQITKKNETYDSIKTNKFKKGIVETLTIELLLENGDLPTSSIIKRIQPELDKKITEAYHQDNLNDDEIDVSSSTLTRWIDETIILFDSWDD